MKDLAQCRFVRLDEGEGKGRVVGLVAVVVAVVVAGLAQVALQCVALALLVVAVQTLVALVVVVVVVVGVGVEHLSSECSDFILLKTLCDARCIRYGTHDTTLQLQCVRLSS